MQQELSTKRRYLAVYLPLLPAERLARESSKAPESPYVLVKKSKGALVIAACDSGALSLGLVPGLPLADARARVPELATFAHDPDKDQVLLDWLVAACERYTPLCAAHLPDTIILDITGAIHFYGDERAIATDLKSRLHRQGLSSRIALGATPDSTRALARFACDDIHALPVEALELESKMLLALRRAGLFTIGHLAVRPRTPLATRFGKACTLKLARLLEEEDPRITPRRPLPVVALERRFAEPIAHSEMVLGMLKELMEEAAIVLAERGQGGRRFQARLFRSDGHIASLAIETGLPTRDAKLLDRLFRERIDSLADPLDPGFGYDMIRLDVPSVESLMPAQAEINGPLDRKGDWQALLDQLSIRFGSERVRFFHVRESHVPERASFTMAATAKISDQIWPTPDPENPPMRPLTLFNPPQAIEVTAGFPDGEPRSFRWRRQVYRVTLVEGPERIAPEWWRHVRGYEPNHGSRNRDYYRAEDKQGKRYWLFRHGSDLDAERPDWYLHGAFA